MEVCIFLAIGTVAVILCGTNAILCSILEELERK